MKSNLTLFWENLTNNKYWVPMLVFAFMGVMATREDILGDFETQGGFWIIEGFCILGLIIIPVMTWITKDSQKDTGPNPFA